MFKKYYAEILIFLFFVLYRLPYLGFDIINTDAPIWKTRTFAFSSAFFSLDFEKTAVTYHPGVILMWLSALGVKIFNLFGDFFITIDTSTVVGYVGLHFSQKLMIIFFLAFVFSICFYLLKKSFSLFYAVVFIFLLTLEPFFLSITRVLHTDGIVTVLSFLTVLCIYYFYNKNKNISWVILSGIATGLALLTKSNSLFLVAFVGLQMFIHSLSVFMNKNKFIFSLPILIKFFKQVFVNYSIWLFFVAISFVVVWPAMWVNPIDTIKLYISGITDVGFEIHYQEWFGKEVADPGPLFYPIVTFIRLTPWFILLSGSGILLSIYSYIRYKRFNSIFLVSFLFIVLYYIFLAIPEKKLGRYASPNFTFLAIFGTYFTIELIKALKEKCKKVSLRFIYFLTPVIFVFLNIISTYKIVPDYEMYFSPLVGGFTGGSKIEEPKWPIGYRKLAVYLNSLENSENRYVLVRYGYLFNPFYVGPTGTLSQKTEKDPGAYFVLEKYSDYRYLRGKGVREVETIQVGGLDYFWVYEIIGNYEVTENYRFVFPKDLKIDTSYR